MKDYNKIKSSQLGMPHGTACAILRKNILYHLLCELGYNICHRCNKMIESIDDLSIDHITPWLHSENPLDLFFDLQNISFSHIKCNTSHARRTNKIETPDGTFWCYRCKKIKPSEEFCKSMYVRKRACTSCESELRAEYRERTGKR